MSLMKVMRHFQDQGNQSVQQAELVDNVLREIELNSNEDTSLEKGIETAKKINSVIQNLIFKESMFLITADAKLKKDRYLSLSINYSNYQDLGDQLQGDGGPAY